MQGILRRNLKCLSQGINRKMDLRREPFIFNQDTRTQYKIRPLIARIKRIPLIRENPRHPRSMIFLILASPG